MTTTESQNIEFKESWRDEYLKWICGFANAQGGTLFVGREDSGRVCGVPDAMKLMEDLPNKVLSLLGILVEVNLKEQDGLQYLEVVTEPSPIQIRVYDNRMEIVNGGVLPDGWTIDTLLAPHRSYPYNPDIANTFFRSGEIESWGRGIQRIINACRRDGFSTPDFRFDPSGFWTVFKYESAQKDVQREETIQEDRQKGETAQESAQKSAQKEEITQETIQRDEQTIQKDVQRKLTEIEQTILTFLKGHPEASRKEISEALSNTTEDSAKHTIARLQKLGMLKRIGGRRLGYWQVLTGDESQETK